MLPSGQEDPFATRDAARRARYREYLDFYEGRQWLGRPLPQERRLAKDYERLCETSEAFIDAAMSRLMVPRLAKA